MHRPFTDRAGYTRHCWECKHAQEWEFDNTATCVSRKQNEIGGAFDFVQYDKTLIQVGKYDSPNNPCSIAGGCEHYER